MAVGDYTVVGPSDFVEQPKRTDETDGIETTIREWQGPASGVEDKIDEIKEELSPDSISVEKSPRSVIIATFADVPLDVAAMDPEDNAVWELIGQDLQKPLQVHPYYHTTDVAPSMIERADQMIRKGTAGSIDWDTEYGAAFHMQHYVSLRLFGIDSYIDFSYIIRKTYTFSNEADFKAEFSMPKDIPGTVISWNDLVVPDRVKFEQPKVHHWDKNAEAWVDKLLVEWLVKSPNVKQQKRPKGWQLIREYWGAEAWAKYIYDGGSWEPPAFA